MINQNNIILKQGHSIIITTLVVSILLNIFISETLANMGYILIAILLFVYRNPSRENFLQSENNVLSPIDGTIIAIDKNKIFIDVSLCNSHTLRAPINSKYTLKYIKNGLNLNHFSLKAKDLNSQAILTFNDITVKLISGICNTKLSFINSDDNISSGDELGLFLHGLVVVENTKKCDILVELNQKVYSNETVLFKV